METRRSSSERRPVVESDQDILPVKREKRQFTAEHKAKLSAAQKGKQFTAERRAKISAAQKGEKNPMYGKKHTAEARAKMSVANKGRKLTAEHKAKLSAAQKGKKHTAETKAKISAVTKKGENPMYGKKHSTETRAKMSAAAKKGENWDKNIEQVKRAIAAVAADQTMKDASLEAGFGAGWLSVWKQRHPERYQTIYIEEMRQLDQRQTIANLGNAALEIAAKE